VGRVGDEMVSVVTGIASCDRGSSWDCGGGGAGCDCDCDWDGAEVVDVAASDDWLLVDEWDNAWKSEDNEYDFFVFGVADVDGGCGGCGGGGGVVK